MLSVECALRQEPELWVNGENRYFGNESELDYYIFFVPGVKNTIQGGTYTFDKALKNNSDFIILSV